MNDAPPKRDIRKPPEGETVTAVFFIKENDRWLTFGPPIVVDPYAIRIDSPPAPRLATLAGAIYWDDQKVFESKPMLCMQGDSFTFHLSNGRVR